MARPGIEPRNSDLRVRCPTDCATRPGNAPLELLISEMRPEIYMMKKFHFLKSIIHSQIQSNLNGSNTLGTMKISSRQGWFEPMRVDNGARSGGIRRIFLIFYNMKVYCVLSLELPH